MLERLLQALKDPNTRRSVFGIAQFSGATFSGKASFDEAHFDGHAWFHKATFCGDASFHEATFTGDAGFGHVTFCGDASFPGATFTAHELGPLACKGQLDLSGAVFRGPVTIEAAARCLNCRRTRWESAAGMRLRYTTVDLTDALPEVSLSITSRPTELEGMDERVREALRSNYALDERDKERLDEGGKPLVRISSLSGIDAGRLALNDVDLAPCRFTGTVHLDQLSLGHVTFQPSPRVRFHLHRPTLIEEHHWRASKGKKGWKPVKEDDCEANAGTIAKPSGLAPLYRQLRKALEDSKNQPDAAGFYYGEMEMRRNTQHRPLVERFLLRGYWAVSGYGLGALRALIWLLAALVLTVVLLMWVGLPAEPRTKGTVVIAGQKIEMINENPRPGGVAPPYPEGFTWPRAERAGRIALNSVLFRSAGQGLTVAGTYIEMTCRLVEPVLLALVFLAVRGRVKR
ncbi:pentapeptide repeat-containing protein [Streptomyces sp. NPDC093546]|uniref:pentapeptide repeat-containing protein n=1 Tax=Streptomyces sp. NPDC093546 TaxID=3366040 RepID=UPI0037FF66D6